MIVLAKLLYIMALVNGRVIFKECCGYCFM